MTWLAVKLFLGGALKRLLSAFGKIWGWATKNPAQALCVVLAASTLWFWRADRKHIVERDKARADVALLVKAQQEAKVKQDAADLANAKAQIERNRKLEQAHAENEADRADAVRDYIATHRLRSQAARCPASGAGQAGVHPDPGVPAGEEPAAGMVAVSEDDLGKLSRGAMRGAECVGFLQSLIDAGQAKAVR